jgi:hypothetical protein
MKTTNTMQKQKEYSLLSGPPGVSDLRHGLLGAVEEASDEEVRKNYDANVFGLRQRPGISLPSHPSAD